MRHWLALPMLALSLVATTVAAREMEATTPAHALQRLHDMPQARAAHSATLLRDGRVLLAGGCHATGCDEGISGDALLFDPKSKTFAKAGNLVQARVGHRAIRLRNGAVLLIGGWTPDGTSKLVEMYDPTSGRFSRQGELLQARDGFSATALRNGNILIAGGYAGDMQRLASAETYDPRTGQSRATAAMATPRMAHTATLLPDGRVLVAGGSSARGQLLDTLELFDPATGRFQHAGRLRKARHKHAAIRIGSDVLVMGGAGVNEFSEQFHDSELWRPGTNRTVPGPAMNDGRYKIIDSVVRLGDGSVLVAGSGNTPERLYYAGKHFTPIAGAIGDDLAFSTATLLGDGRVLVAGGYAPGIHPSRGAWIYEPNYRSMPEIDKQRIDQ